MMPVSYEHCSLILDCSACGCINYLDPFSFWYFKGKVKCAKCNAVWFLEIENGQRLRGPEQAEPPHDKLPGFAQTKEYQETFYGPGKTALAPQARPDFQGKPIPIYKNIKGAPVSGGPLTPEEVDWRTSRPKFIMEGKPYKA